MKHLLLALALTTVTFANTLPPENVECEMNLKMFEFPLHQDRPATMVQLEKD